MVSYTIRLFLCLFLISFASTAYCAELTASASMQSFYKKRKREMPYQLVKKARTLSSIVSITTAKPVEYDEHPAIVSDMSLTADMAFFKKHEVEPQLKEQLDRFFSQKKVAENLAELRQAFDSFEDTQPFKTELENLGFKFIKKSEYHVFALKSIASKIFKMARTKGISAELWNANRLRHVLTLKTEFQMRGLDLNVAKKSIYFMPLLDMPAKLFEYLPRMIVVAEEIVDTVLSEKHKKDLAIFAPLFADSLEGNMIGNTICDTEVGLRVAKQAKEPQERKESAPCKVLYM